MSLPYDLNLSCHSAIVITSFYIFFLLPPPIFSLQEISSLYNTGVLLLLTVLYWNFLYTTDDYLVSILWALDWKTWHSLICFIFPARRPSSVIKLCTCKGGATLKCFIYWVLNLPNYQPFVLLYNKTVWNVASPRLLCPLQMPNLGSDLSKPWKFGHNYIPNLLMSLARSYIQIRYFCRQIACQIHNLPSMHMPTITNPHMESR